MPEKKFLLHLSYLQFACILVDKVFINFLIWHYPNCDLVDQEMKDYGWNVFFRYLKALCLMIINFGYSHIWETFLEIIQLLATEMIKYGRNKQFGTIICKTFLVL